MRRFQLAVLAFTFFAGSVCGQTSDEEKFLLARNEKRLLDPQSESKEFETALTYLRKSPAGREVLLKGANSYKKQDKDDRYRFIVQTVCASQKPKDVLDSWLPHVFFFLDSIKKNDKKGSDYSDVIIQFVRYVGELGKRGTPALKTLEWIRDNSQQDMLAVAALRAIKAVEADK